jgi:hypothetical protein
MCVYVNVYENFPIYTSIFVLISDKFSIHCENEDFTWNMFAFLSFFLSFLQERRRDEKLLNANFQTFSIRPIPSTLPHSHHNMFTTLFLIYVFSLWNAWKFIVILRIILKHNISYFLSSSSFKGIIHYPLSFSPSTLCHFIFFFSFSFFSCIEIEIENLFGYMFIEREREREKSNTKNPILSAKWMHKKQYLHNNRWQKTFSSILYQQLHMYRC